MFLSFTTGWGNNSSRICFRAHTSECAAGAARRAPAPREGNAFLPISNSIIRLRGSTKNIQGRREEAVSVLNTCSSSCHKTTRLMFQSSVHTVCVIDALRLDPGTQ